MNLWAEVSFLLFVLLYKKVIKHFCNLLIFEFDFPFMINGSGMVGRLFCLCIALRNISQVFFRLFLFSYNSKLKYLSLAIFLTLSNIMQYFLNALIFCTVGFFK